MRPTEKKIQNLIQNLNDQTRHELDQKILDSCFTELDTPQPSASVKRPNRWRIFMKNPITKYAIAAIIMMAGLFSLTYIDKIPFCERFLHNRVNSEFLIGMK